MYGDELAAGLPVEQVTDGRGDLVERVAPVDGGGDRAGLDELAEGAQVSVTIDHNVVDGAPATRFGADLRRRMECPADLGLGSGT